MERQMNNRPVQHRRAPPITVIGAGHTGSAVVWDLAEAGRPSTVWDDDIVTRKNLRNQRYVIADVGSKKVEALARTIAVNCGLEIIAVTQRFTRGQLAGIVVTGVDTMTDRTHIWESSIKYQPAVELYVETRTHDRGGRVYAIRPTQPPHVDRYEATLYSDEQADSTSCQFVPLIVARQAATFAVAAIEGHLMAGAFPNEIVFSLEPFHVRWYTF